MTRVLPKKRPLEQHEVDESGDLIVHDQVSGQMVVLNAVGSAILELVDGNRDLSAIVDELLFVFPDASREQVERDVMAFLADLATRQLIDLSTETT